MKIRKLFRGSGRVLAFVFVASVIWLLFDMAALRLSFNDVNSQLLKEIIVKERAAMKRQATRRPHVENRVFKNPVQKVPVDLGNNVKNTKTYKNIAEVYRKKQKPDIKENNVAQDVANPKPESVDLQSAKSDKKVNAKQIVESVNGHEIAKSSQKELNLRISKTVNVSSSDKVKLLKAVTQKIKGTAAKEKSQAELMSNAKDRTLSKAPSGVQEERHVITIGAQIKEEETKKEKKKENINVSQNKSDSETVKPGLQKHVLKNYTKEQSKSDLQVVEVINNAQQKTASLNKSDPHPIKTQGQLTPQARPQNMEPNQDNRALVQEKGGLHKVVALDVTLKPRDVRAVGQFGHAAVVPKDKEQESQSRWNEGHFNVYLSEQIPVDRSIPDTRPAS